MLLHLVRHAEAAADEDGDPGLSARGRAQADLLARTVPAAQAVSLLHSPARRARETASVLAAKLGTAPQQSALVRDLTPVPESTGDDAYPAHARAWLASVPDPQRDPGAAALDAALVEVCTRAATKPLLVVTHAHVVAWFTARLLGAPPDTWLRLPVANASLTTFGRNRFGEPVLHRFNETP